MLITDHVGGSRGADGAAAHAGRGSRVRAGWGGTRVKATGEQEAARDAFASGADVALVAGAGTGKTSTLVMMGSASPRRGLYIAFNKPIAQEAQARFGPNVQCRTSHSLAHRAVGRAFQDRLNASRDMPLKRTAQLLGLERDLAVGKRRIRATTQARLVREMVQRFCWSTDEQVTARHLGRVNGLDEQGEQYLAQTLLRRARWAWEDICSPRGSLPGGRAPGRGGRSRGRVRCRTQVSPWMWKEGDSRRCTDVRGPDRSEAWRGSPDCGKRLLTSWSSPPRRRRVTAGRRPVAGCSGRCSDPCAQYSAGSLEPHRSVRGRTAPVGHGLSRHGGRARHAAGRGSRS